MLSLPYRALHQHHPLSNCNSIRDTRDEMLAERNQYEHGDRCLLSVKERRRAMTDEEDALFGIDKPNVARSEIPAVTHVDYSARLQTVHREINPRYHALLSVFKAKTGCPVRSRSQRRGLRCGGTDGLHDSPLEGTGFEPSVPLLRRLFWALPIGDGGTKGGATYRFRSETAMLTWSGSP